MQSLINQYRRAARWAWVSNEIDPRVTREETGYKALLVGTLLAISFAVGGILWLGGQSNYAFFVWLFGSGFTVYFGILTIGWDLLEHIFATRNGARKEPLEREASRGPAADITISLDSTISLLSVLVTVLLSRDSKISFLMTVILLASIGTGAYLVSLLL